MKQSEQEECKQVEDIVNDEQLSDLYATQYLRGKRKVFMDYEFWKNHTRRNINRIFELDTFNRNLKFFFYKNCKDKDTVEFHNYRLLTNMIIQELQCQEYITRGVIGELTSKQLIKATQRWLRGESRF
jgi:hypothetical protein